MDDLISKQGAIDAFEKELSAKYNKREFAIGFVGVKSILENLPSVQPNLQLTCNQFATDCINRQAAIDVASRECHEWRGIFSDIEQGLKELPSVQPEQELLKDGTLVVKTDFDMTKFDRVNIIQNGTHYGDLFYQDDDTRRSGKWIRWHETLEDASGVEYMPRCKCSECGEEYEAHSTRFINFCPNCGADMREGDA